MNIDAEGRLGPEWGGVRVVEAAQDIRLTRAIWIMSLAVVLYDYVLTFDDEVNFMWSGKLKFIWTRSLFATSRYWTILNLVIHNIILALDNPPDTLCRVWYFYVVFATAGTSLTTTVIAQLRLYAMYSCNRKLLLMMVTAVTLSFGVQGPILLIMVVKAKTFRLPPVHTGCYAVDPIPYLLPYWISWVPYLAYESFIFALAIYKSIALARDQPETPWLVYILLRDSVVFFGGTFSIVLINCLVNALGRPHMFSAFTALYIALYSILGCRMLLNVRAAANPWVKWDTSLYGFSTQERMNVSTVRFAPPDQVSGYDGEAFELQGISQHSSFTSPNDSTRNLL